MTDRDEKENYADEVILRIKNQLKEYGQAANRDEREHVPLSELTVVKMD